MGNNQKLKILTPLIHILFWLLLFFLPAIVRFSSTGFTFSSVLQNRLVLNSLILIAFFYFNAYFLFPVIYKRRGLLLYVASLVLAVFLLSNGVSYAEKEFFPMKRKRESFETAKAGVAGSFRNNEKDEKDQKRHWQGKKGFGYLYFSILPYIFIIGISVSYRIVRDSSREEKIRKEKENENLKAELSFLRSQVSPHFMFNVLNTLVAMARKKSDLMEPSLIQLSNLMRYMLYESNDERISLSREVEYLKSYIDLQLLRFGDSLNIELNIGKGIDDYEMEPMLLISFVENAFKHGIGMVEEPFIKIDLSVDKQKHLLHFKVENTVAPEDGSKDKSSGIGLQNMRRRLELLYKDRYTLETSKHDSIFVSSLNIRLK